MSKEDNKEEAPEQEQSIWRSLGGTLLYLLVIVLLTWVIVTFVGQRTKVDGHSMEPTLSDGDNLIVDKLSYRFRDPERYDIIVFPYQHAENTYYIKRIIGLPGETVQVIDGYMYINGKKLDEHYGAEVMKIRELQQSRLNWEMMNILSWEITGIIARTVVWQVWVYLPVIC